MSLPRFRNLAPGWRLLLFVLALVLAGWVVGLLWWATGLPPQRQHHLVRAWPQLLTGLLAVGVVTSLSWAFLRLGDGVGLRAIGLALGPKSWKAVTVGLAIGAATPMLVEFLFRLTGTAHVRPEPVTAVSVVTLTIPMCIAVALVSSWEEIFLRGYALAQLVRIRGTMFAAIVSGLVFGLLHSGNPGANPAGVIAITLNGALLALLVLRTGSLVMSCGYHAGWNLTAALLLGLRDSGTVHEGAFLRTELVGPTWLTGGEFGFEASLVTAGVEFSVLAAALMLVRWLLPSDPVARDFYVVGEQTIRARRRNAM